MTQHNTGIEWTHIPGFKGETWNAIVGCDVVSPGCTNCYAMRVAGQRLDGNPKTPHYAGTTKASKAGPVWTGKVAMAGEKAFTAPLRWAKPRAVFVNSMGDLFHESVPDAWIDRVFAFMALSPQHVFIVLTKRAERMRAYLDGPFPGDGVCARIAEQIAKLDATPGLLKPNLYEGRVYIRRPVGPIVNGEPEFGYRTFLQPHLWPLRNVWLGVSVEDQARADERIPHLLATPAAIRFVSFEPLLGPVDLSHMDINGHVEARKLGLIGGYWINALTGKNTDMGRPCPDVPRLDWVIAGGESGTGARPMHPDWARGLRDECRSAQVPFFMKQMAQKAPIPEELLVREWPHAAR